MTLMKSILCLLSLAALVLSTSACSSILPKAKSDDSRFYVLDAKPDTVFEADVPGPLLVNVVIPGYLAKPTIARRVNEHEVTYHDKYRWAEPLDTAVERLIEAMIKPTASVDKEHPSTRTLLEVTILRFEQQDDEVVLHASWRWNKASEATTVLLKEPTGSGKESLVAAHNTLVQRLAETIANSQ